jgi:hypothetical protein
MQLTPANASWIGAAGANVVAEFPGNGLWRYNSATGWQQLTPADAAMVAINPIGDVAAQFNGNGLWRFQNSTQWIQLTPADAAQVAIDDLGDVAAQFDGNGVWRYEDATLWQMLSPAQASAVAIGGAGNVAAEFNGQGVWRFENATGWLQLTPADAAQLSTDSLGDVAAQFSNGSWRYEDAAGWQLVSPAIPTWISISSLAGIVINSGPLAFMATQGGASPAPETLLFTNYGTSAATFSATFASSNLPAGDVQFTPGSGSVAPGQSASITFTVNTSGLTANTSAINNSRLSAAASSSAGTYSGTVTVQFQNGTTYTLTTPLTVNVQQPPALQANPGSLFFTVTLGQAPPATQDVMLTNVGGGFITYAATIPPGGVQIGGAPAGRLVAGQSSTLTVSVDPTQYRAPGVFQATITIAWNGQTLTVGVTVTVQEDPYAGTYSGTMIGKDFLSDGSTYPVNGTWNATEANGVITINFTTPVTSTGRATVQPNGTFAGSGSSGDLGFMFSGTLLNGTAAGSWYASWPAGFEGLPAGYGTGSFQGLRQ